MSVVGIDIISKRGKRRKYLPLEMRMKMYEDVVELRRQGLKPSRIQEKLFEKYKGQLCMKSIYNWINGKHYPFGSINKFDEKPSPELAYIIGVILSDGYKYIDSWHYYLRLAVNDEEFAKEFGKCLAVVLKKKELYKPFWNENRRQWIVSVCSILLFKFLEKLFEKLKFYIEYSEETVASFLRAMFDGEGTMHKYKRELRLYNTNEELLVYIQYLLKRYFNIDTTGPYLSRKKGDIGHFPNGKVYETNEDCYYIHICAKSLFDFYKHIGFTISRKQQRLIKAIK